MAFLYVHHAPGAPCGDQQIRLAAKKRRNLQHVADFGRRADLRDIVHVGQDRQASVFLDGRENAQAFFQPRAAKGGDGRAVGFVVGSFEDEGNAQLAGDGADSFGHGRRVRFAFDHARSGDQKKRSISAEVDIADLKCSRRSVM